MKRCFTFLMAAMLLASCLLAGCEIKRMEEPFTYECDEDILYTAEQLTEIDAFMGTKREFFEKYPTCYVTEYDNGESRFLYYTEDSVLAIYFDSEEERDMVMNDTFTLSVPLEEFSRIKVGTTIEEVEEIDPNGFYPYETGTHHSSHYTVDKHIVWISYSSDYIVIDIKSESLTD